MEAQFYFPHAKRALLVVDVQNDFCAGGALAVPDGDAVVGPSNVLLNLFEHSVLTQDFHPRDHISFAVNHHRDGQECHFKNEGCTCNELAPKHEFELLEFRGITQTLWPVHCVAATEGAEFHPQLETQKAQLIIRKGYHRLIDSYSAFFENDQMTTTGLHGYLTAHGIKEVVLTGLALDYCVFYTARDALQLGYTVTIIEDAVRAVNVPAGSGATACTELTGLGVQFMSLAQACKLLEK